MSKFISKRILSLKFLGKEWENCFLAFSSLTVKESRVLMVSKIQSKEPAKIIDLTLDLLREHFLEGNGYDSETKELVKITKEDLDDLPSMVLEKAVLFLVGDTSLTDD
jgi:hypothetical protein